MHVPPGDDLPGVEDRQPLDDVGELAHVAGPPVVGHELHGLGGPRHESSSRARALVQREVVNEGGEVLHAIPERRQRQRNHVEAKVEILAEHAFAHRAREILVGGGDDPHVDADRLGAAQSLDLFGLDRAQQFGLGFRSQIPHFVEQQRTGVGHLEPADPASGGSGKRAALVAEHLALDQVARDRRAVDAHEWAITPRTRFVDRRRHELLAGPRLTADEHARIARRHPRDQIRDSPHRRAGAYELTGQPQLFAQRARGFPRLPEVERRDQRQQHRLGRQRLLEEIERPELGGADGVAQSRATAHHDDRQLGVALPQFGQGRQPVECARHHQVQQHGVGHPLRGRRDPRGAIWRVAHFVSLADEQRGEHPTDIRFVIDDQYGCHQRLTPSSEGPGGADTGSVNRTSVPCPASLHNSTVP